MQVLCGDIGNDFIQDNTKEKFYTRCGPEFDEHQHSIAVLVQALYGLTTSADRFSTVLFDFLHVTGFKPT